MRFANCLAIDLGTCHIAVSALGRGPLIDEPTVVAIDRRDERIVAFGEEAKAMLGRTPENIRAVQPLREGVIADYTVALSMLRYVIERTCGMAAKLGFGPKVLLTVPSSVTNVERRAVIQAARRAGARSAETVEEPLAAARGAGLDIEDGGGHVVVDIGGGMTDMAVLSLGGIVKSDGIRVGGNKLDEAIARHVRNEYGILIGETTAEQVKRAIGWASPSDESGAFEVSGRDMVKGLPKTQTLRTEEVRDAMTEPLRQIAERVCVLLETTPPELASDIAKRGLVLTGGGALLPGIDTYMANVTHVPVRIATGPDRAVIRGLEMFLEISR